MQKGKILLLIVLMTGTTAFQPTAAQKTIRKVSEKLLSGIGVSEMLNTSYIISNDLRRISFRLATEGKEMVVVDTVRGKLYDRVGNPVFSPDGKRIAYGAKRDTNWMVIVDQKQEAILDSGNVINTILFSPDAKTYAYLVWNGTKFYLVNNGIKGKLYDYIDVNSIKFSADSRKIVYAAGLGKMHFNVVDRTEGPAFDQIGFPVLSPDGQHVAYWGGSDNQFYAIVDNKKSESYESIGTILFSGDSKHTAFNAVIGGKHIVVLDGIASEKYDLVHSLVLSPDGSRLAYGIEFAQGDKAAYKDYVVVDGKKAGPYESVAQGSLMFSPDGTDLAYKVEWHDDFFMASNRNKKMIYGDILQSTMVFSPNSMRLAFGADNNARRMVNLDDNEIGPYDDVYSIAFSPDSKRLAYSVKSDNKEFVVVDGHDGKPYDALLGQGAIIFDSSDSFHYVATRGNHIYLVEEKFE